MSARYPNCYIIQNLLTDGSSTYDVAIEQDDENRVVIYTATHYDAISLHQLLLAQNLADLGMVTAKA